MCFISCNHFNHNQNPPDIEAILNSAQTSSDRGDFEAAIAAWEKALPLLITAGNHAAEIDVRTNLGGAEISIGADDLAIENLTTACAEAEATDDIERRILALNALGTAYTFAPRGQWRR